MRLTFFYLPKTTATMFSRITAGEIPCYKIAESDRFFTFLNVNPLVKRHTLVVPKQEVDYIFNLSDGGLTAMHIFAEKVARTIEETSPCRKVNETIIGLGVPHTRIHLIPIQKESDTSPSDPKLELSDEEFESITQAISPSLQNMMTT